MPPTIINPRMLIWYSLCSISNHFLHSHIILDPLHVVNVHTYSKSIFVNQNTYPGFCWRLIIKSILSTISLASERTAFSDLWCHSRGHHIAPIPFLFPYSMPRYTGAKKRGGAISIFADNILINFVFRREQIVLHFELIFYHNLRRQVSKC